MAAKLRVRHDNWRTPHYLAIANVFDRIKVMYVLEIETKMRGTLTQGVSPESKRGQVLDLAVTERCSSVRLGGIMELLRRYWCR